MVPQNKKGIHPFQDVYLLDIITPLQGGWGASVNAAEAVLAEALAFAA